MVALVARHVSGLLIRQGMLDHLPNFTKPPIVEVVVDIDCDMPPTFDLTAVESSARDAFRATYPKLRKQLIQAHHIEQTTDSAPKVSTASSAVSSLQFVKEDGCQLAQVRTSGFTFNRLPPYTGFDNYLPEIQDAWECFRRVVSPVRIRKISLRYINRILLPLEERGALELDHYLKISPQLPAQGMMFTGFLNQHSVRDVATGLRANIILNAQGTEGDSLPVIFDLEAISDRKEDPTNWERIQTVVGELRNLNNRIFRNTLTDRCLNLFQH